MKLFPDFTLSGRTFRVSVEHDDDQTPPWKTDDCHGFVSELTPRAKRPGERPLHRGRTHKLYYDWQATMVKAKAEQWGANIPAAALFAYIPASVSALTLLTHRQRAAAAVEADYRHLRRFCTGDWCYAAVTVSMLDTDDSVLDFTTLCRIEYDFSRGNPDLDETIRELAEGLLADDLLPCPWADMSTT